MKNFKKGYSININITGEDNKLIEASKELINRLEEEYTIFHKKIEKSKTSFKEFKEKLKENKKPELYFKPETLSRMSPMTIINAPWGTGKTFFIENFAQHLLLGELKNNIFKNVIIIDAWKHSNAKNIPDEIICEIFYALQGIYNDKPQKSELLKISKKLFNATALSWTNRFLGTDFNKIATEDNNSIETLIENFNSKKNDVKTLIFIDNVERLGKSSWEVIKAIVKLAQLKNFIFILPMHVPKMHDNKPTDGSELPIEKYIDMPMFNFHQDYENLFQQLGFPEKIINDLVIIFKTEENGSVLTIREVKQRLNSISESDKNNKYKIFNLIYNKVWGPLSVFKGLLLNDVENSIKLINNKTNIIIDANNLIATFLILDNDLDYIRDLKQIVKNINDDLKENINLDLNIFTDYSKLLKNLIEAIKNQISKILEKKQELRASLEKKKLTLSNLNIKITDLTQRLKKENSDEFEGNKNSEKIWELERQIEIQEEDVPKLSNKIELIEKDLISVEKQYKIVNELNDKLNNLQKDFNDNLQNWDLNISNEIKSYYIEHFNYNNWGGEINKKEALITKIIEKTLS